MVSTQECTLTRKLTPSSPAVTSSRILYVNDPSAIRKILNNISLAIPTVDNGGNHTPGFTQAARSLEAHKACLNISKALAGVGIRVLTDEEFIMKVCARMIQAGHWLADSVNVRFKIVFKRTRNIEEWCELISTLIECWLQNILGNLYTTE